MARDKIHFLVKEILEKEGWLITHDPYQLKVLEMEYEIDLGAEEIVGAEKEGRKIAVEVKSFMKGSLTYEFHGILGQFLNYTIGLEEKEPDRQLFLAVPADIYDSFFQREAVQIAINRFQINLIIFEPTQKIIQQWHVH